MSFNRRHEIWTIMNGVTFQQIFLGLIRRESDLLYRKARELLLEEHRDLGVHFLHGMINIEE